MGNTIDTTKLEYQSLAAKELEGEEKKRIQPYLMVLDRAVKDKYAKNIAVIGKFGAGKTTVINTYLADYSTEKKDNKSIFAKMCLFSSRRKGAQARQIINPLRLSVANFTKPKGDAEEEWVGIERSLVQQILYRPSNKTLLKSKFRKIEPTKRLFKIFNWVVVLIFIFSGIFLSNILGTNQIIFGKSKLFNILFGYSFIVALVLLIILGIIYFPIYFNVSKVSFGKTELTVNENKSAFNEYLDEILYFFIQTKYNLVVLEDIDRFDDINIFEHLRELNELLNNNKTLRKVFKVSIDRPAIKFIYAVKEDLFNRLDLTSVQEESQMVDEHNAAEATTKFFDWVIPIIPSVSTNNAADFLIKRLDLNDEDFNYFLRSIAIYFDDIRVLGTIINDFKLYSEVLANGGELDAKKMFTVLCFKNAFPDQYQKFQHKNSSLYSLLFGDQYRELLTLTLNKRIDLLKDQRKRAQKFSEQQLVWRYQAKFFNDGIGAARDFEVEGVFDSRLNKEAKNLTFEDLKRLYGKASAAQAKGRQVKIRYHENSHKFNGLNSQNFGEFFIQDKDLDSHTIFTMGAGNTIHEKLSQEIADLEMKINTIKQFPVKQLIQLDSEEKIEQILGDIGESKLFLRFAISEGYLDETIEDYLTRFSGQRISANDRSVIRSLRSGMLLPFNQKIDNVPNFVADCLPMDFNKPGIVIAELIRYGAKNANMRDDIKNAYEQAIRFFGDQSQSRFSHNVDYLLNNNLFTAWPKFLNDMSQQLNYDWLYYTGSNFAKLAALILNNVRYDTLKQCLQTTPRLIEFINSDRLNYNHFFKEHSMNRIEAVYKSKLIKLNALTEVPSIKAADFLLDNNQVQFTSKTIQSIFDAFNSDNLDITPSYYLVKKINNKKLQEFVDKNLSEFVSVEIDIVQFTDEREDSLVELLKSSVLSKDLKNQLIRQYRYHDLKLEDISDDLINVTFETERYSKSWQNLRFLVERNRDEEVTKFLSQSNDFQNMDFEATQKESDLLEQVIDNNRINITPNNLEIVKQYTKYVGYNQSIGTLKIMIENNLVNLSEKLVDELSDPKNIMILAKNRLSKVPKKWDEIENALFKKIALTDLLEITLDEDNHSLSFARGQALELITTVYIEQLTDQKRFEIGKYCLNNIKEDKDYLYKIFLSFSNLDFQIRLIMDALNNDTIENNCIIELFLKADSDELNKLIFLDQSRPGQTTLVNFLGSEALLQQLNQRSLIGRFSMNKRYNYWNIYQIRVNGRQQ